MAFHYVAQVCPKTATSYNEVKEVNIIASSINEAELFLSQEYDVLNVMTAKEAHGIQDPDI